VTAVEASFAVIIVGVLLILALSQHFSNGRRLHRLSQGRLNTKMRNKQKGFSLIELLIVVAIILIIASMAIPNLIRSKMAANEASAVASIRTINTSEVVYSSTYNVANGFSADLKSLGDGGTAGTCTATFVPTSAAACLIDPSLENATTAATAKSGYYFTYAQGTGSYAINADPVQVNSTGVRGFYSDQTVVIRFKSPGPAGATDQPI
jgi:type IV pilus assembly protein PilA